MPSAGLLPIHAVFEGLGSGMGSCIRSASFRMLVAACPASLIRSGALETTRIMTDFVLPSG